MPGAIESPPAVLQERRRRSTMVAGSSGCVFPRSRRLPCKWMRFRQNLPFQIFPCVSPGYHTAQRLRTHRRRLGPFFLREPSLRRSCCIAFSAPLRNCRRTHLSVNHPLSSKQNAPIGSFLVALRLFSETAITRKHSVMLSRTAVAGLLPAGCVCRSLRRWRPNGLASFAEGYSS